MNFESPQDLMMARTLVLNVFSFHLLQCTRAKSGLHKYRQSKGIYIYILSRNIVIVNIIS